MAATKDAVLVDNTKTLGSDLSRLGTIAREFRALNGDIKLKLDHLNDGTDFSDVETQAGLVVGKGTVLVTLINTLQTQLASSTAFADVASKILPK